MSKTVDELVEEFRNHPTTREGVKAIVRVLRENFIEAYLAGRDEEKPYGQIATGAESFVSDLLNEILGAAGEKVAGSTPEGAVLSSSAEGEPPASPATDPAPAVCEWTPQDEGPAHEIWKTACGTMYERAKSTGWCNRCKAPIKFTEAK